MRTVQLVVTYMDNTIMYYDTQGGWKIDAATNCLVISRCMNAKRIWLGVVRVLELQETFIRDTDGQGKDD